MKIEKELHEFLRDVILNKKIIQYRSVEKNDNDWSDWSIEDILKDDFEQCYELRIIEDVYYAGDKFRNELDEEFILVMEEDTKYNYNIFRFISLSSGKMVGYSAEIRDRNYITQYEIDKMTTDEKLVLNRK